MYKVKVFVTLKPAVLNPQGKAVQSTLQELGYATTSNVRIGKYIELDLEADDQNQAEEQVKAICEQVLVNAITEDYRFELVEV